MRKPVIIPAPDQRSFAFVFLGLALCIACHPTGEPNPVPPVVPMTESTVSTPVGMPASSTASASRSTAPAPSSTAVANAQTPTPLMTDPGPGLIGCGKRACKVGQEVCRLDIYSNGGGRRYHCVPVAQLHSKPVGGGPPCDRSFDYKACDGPGDCAAGETCCYQRYALIGACFMDPDYMLEKYTCRPLRKSGRIACRNAEICSAKQPHCVRQGATCVLDSTKGIGTCEAPRRGPNCAAAPCPRGSLCVELSGGTRKCATVGAALPPKARIVECDRGRDCAADEACFSYSGDKRCDFSALSWAGNDLPVCVDASDCTFCNGKHVKGVCYNNHGMKFCECRWRCRRDADCAESCFSLSLNRQGGSSYPRLVHFCDKKKRLCDCREPPATP